MKTIVIKLGGSLLSQSGVYDRLREWLDQSKRVDNPSKRVLIVGGGEAVDALRRIDAENPLPHDAAHWAAIDVMEQHARLLANCFTEVELTSQLDRIRRSELGGDWIFAPGDWLRRHEPSMPGRQLSRGWQVTSDSIAARLAEVLRAKLVLIKSVSAENFGKPINWPQAAQIGLVDRCFPDQIDGITGAEVINLPLAKT